MSYIQTHGGIFHSKSRKVTSGTSEMQHWQGYWKSHGGIIYGRGMSFEGPQVHHQRNWRDTCEDVPLSGLWDTTGGRKVLQEHLITCKKILWIHLYTEYSVTALFIFSAQHCGLYIIYLICSCLVDDYNAHDPVLNFHFFFLGYLGLGLPRGGKNKWVIRYNHFENIVDIIIISIVIVTVVTAVLYFLIIRNSCNLVFLIVKILSCILIIMNLCYYY